MACSSCSCSPCICVPSCAEDCPEVIDYTFSNGNLSGIGVMESFSSGTGEVIFKGIRSANSAILVTNDAATKTVLLTANPDAFQGTATWANAAARALDAPGFIGQIGIQLDTNVQYQGTGLSAGDWGFPVVTLNGTNTIATGTTTVLAMAGTGAFDLNLNGTGNFDITGTSSGRVRVTDLGVDFFNSDLNLNATSSIVLTGAPLNLVSANLNIDAASAIVSSGNLTLGGTVNLTGTTNNAGTIDNASVMNSSGSINVTGVLNVNGAGGGRLHIDAAAATASSVITTTAVAGRLTTKPTAQFLSTSNTQTGWGTPTGVLTRTTYDTATVTLPQLAERVAALITDLKAVLLPAT